MACCKVPDYIKDKLDGVMKELRLNKLSKVLRVAAELSWSEWNKSAVVEKLYPQFNRVEKQGHKTRLRLEQIAESLMHQFKRLNYKFPPRESFCSTHMWFSGEVSSRRIVKQNQEESTSVDQHATPVRKRKPESQEPAEMPSTSGRVPRSETQDYVISIAESVSRRRVFRETAGSLGEQELVPLVQAVVNNLSEDENTTDYEIISRVEAHLMVVNSLGLYSSNAADVDAANSSSSPLVSLRMRSSDRTIEAPSVKMLSAAASEIPSPQLAIPVEAPAIPDEPVVHYETHDAEVTANILSFLTCTDMEWSVLSDTFNHFVVHALKLRASRLAILYKEKCAQVGRIIEYTEPMHEKRKHSLQEDRAALTDVLAKYESANNDLTDVFYRHMALYENLPSLPEQVSVMSCIPITIRWNLPASIPEIIRKRWRDEWINFQVNMKTWSIQIQQAPNSLESLQLLVRIPETVKQESPVVLKHTRVQDWLEAVHKLSKAIRSRDGRKAEIEGIVYQLRDRTRRSREALEEIKRKLAELAQCDHQVCILRERSQARLNSITVKSKDRIAQHDNLMRDVPNLNVTAADGESDAAQEHTFGVERCVMPWAFSEIVSLLQPLVVNLSSFVHSGYDKENLGNLLNENVNKEISLLAGTVCNSRVSEVLATLRESEGREDPSSSSSSRRPPSSNATGDNDRTAAHKKQRRD